MWKMRFTKIRTTVHALLSVFVTQNAIPRRYIRSVDLPGKHSSSSYVLGGG